MVCHWAASMNHAFCALCVPDTVIVPDCARRSSWIHCLRLIYIAVWTPWRSRSTLGPSSRLSRAGSYTNKERFPKCSLTDGKVMRPLSHFIQRLLCAIRSCCLPFNSRCNYFLQGCQDFFFQCYEITANSLPTQHQWDDLIDWIVALPGGFIRCVFLEETQEVYSLIKGTVKILNVGGPFKILEQIRSSVLPVDQECIFHRYQSSCSTRTLTVCGHGRDTVALVIEVWEMLIQN